MSELQITFGTAGKQKDIQVVKPVGSIDNISAEQFKNAIKSLIDKETYKIIIDLTEVEYISSAGWGTLMGHIKRVRQKNGDIKLACMRPTLQETFNFLDLNSVLESYKTVEIASFIF